MKSFKEYITDKDIEDYKKITGEPSQSDINKAWMKARKENLPSKEKILKQKVK